MRNRMIGPFPKGVSMTIEEYYDYRKEYAKPYFECPNGGVRVGEIVAKRCWIVYGDRLTSTFINGWVWKPGAIQKATDPFDPSNTEWNLLTMTAADGIQDASMYGIHAFKEEKYIISYIAGIFRSTRRNDTRCMVAVGTVNLWGDVVEHNRGYRAEYASIRSIDKFYIKPSWDKIRLLERDIDWWEPTTYFSENFVIPNEDPELLKILRDIYGV